jgi:hypothetical protein
MQLFTGMKNLFHKEDELQIMSKPEKKEFLSNDFIARMIRLEQRVSASFGEVIPYNKTKYYQSLTESERKKFEAYLKTKIGSKFLLLFVGLFFVGGFLLKGSMTGNVIGSSDGFSWEGLILIFLSFIGLGFLLTRHITKKRKERVFNSVVGLFDRSIRKRHR